jgi:hypothetical protein
MHSTHPTGTICLFQLHSRRIMKTSVEYTNIIKAKKPTFEDVVAVHILPVYPPGEIDE